MSVHTASQTFLLRTMGLTSLLFALMVQGCTATRSAPEQLPPRPERVQSDAHGNLRVSVSVPTAAEAKAIYGVDLTARDIQPVWIEVENATSNTYWMMDVGLDPDNFSTSEVASAFSGAEDASKDLEQRLEALRFQNPVASGQSVAGFVLTHLDRHLKAVQVDLIARGDAQSFAFVVQDPTSKLTSSDANFEDMYSPSELISVSDHPTLRRILKQLPCCTMNRQGTNFGDPLNLVLVGEMETIISALLRRNWRPTESLRSGSFLRTVDAFLSGSRYLSMPMSPLHVFGRPQDLAAQKARATIHERNHARFWLTPVRYRGIPVWIGQISRDIGVKYTLKSPTISTHVIDPDVDEARYYFIEDMAFSQALEAFGFVEGVGKVARAEPRYNLVDDPYHTDGLRAVLIFSQPKRSVDQIDWLDWATPRSLREEPLQ
jgi:acyl-CoA synthetase (AMP-forming)/AMP-acid ligase II